MPVGYKQILALKKDMANDLSEETIEIIKRIEECQNVVGVLYFQKNMVQLCTVPENFAQTLSAKIPQLNSAVSRALTEIDVLDKLIAYRVVTRNTEIIVATGKEFTACVVHRTKKKHRQLKKLLA